MHKFSSMFKEPGGKWSFSRISTAVVLAAWLTWVSICVCRTSTLPAGVWEISTLVAALYGINKATTVISNGKTK